LEVQSARESRDVVGMADKPLKPPKPKKESDDTTGLWSYKRLSVELGLPIGTLYSLVAKGQIPYVRLSKRLVRFDPTEVAGWVDARRVPVTGARP
jgi:excisionase family DNA binding protein